MLQSVTGGVYGRTMQKCPDPSEKCLPLGEGGPAQAGPDEVEGNSVVPTYVIIASFDLISQPLRAASFPSRGSLTPRR